MISLLSVGLLEHLLYVRSDYHSYGVCVFHYVPPVRHTQYLLKRDRTYVLSVKSGPLDTVSRVHLPPVLYLFLGTFPCVLTSFTHLQ